MSFEVHVAAFSDLTAKQFHDIARLRVDVFVVEQDCAYPELDGEDSLETTRHYWIEDAEGIATYLRTVESDTELRIGRVATDPRCRGEGLAARMMEEVLGCSQGVIVLSAQTHLTAWYERFGFVVEGESYLEDGIPHTDMRRSPHS